MMHDVTLQDVIYVVLAVGVFVAVGMLWDYRKDQIVAFLRGVVRSRQPRTKIHVVKPRESVKPNPMLAPVVMSRQAADGPDRPQTDQTDKRVSVGDQWLDRLQRDITKEAVIELMVYSGWSVSQIRAVIRGDNNVIGAEVADARKRLGLAVDQPKPNEDYTTPIAGRPTQADFANRPSIEDYYPDRPDLKYKPLERE